MTIRLNTQYEKGISLSHARLHEYSQFVQKIETVFKVPLLVQGQKFMMTSSRRHFVKTYL